MHAFKDRTGRAWNLDLNVTAVKGLRKTLNVDLLAVADGKTLARITADPCLLADVLYVLVRPQAESQGVSDVQFGEALAGDAIDSATEALLDELVDFFPGQNRTLLTKVMAKAKEVSDLEHSRAMKELDQSAEQLIELYGQKPETRGNTSTSSADSSDSTRVLTPGAS